MAGDAFHADFAALPFDQRFGNRKSQPINGQIIGYVSIGFTGIGIILALLSAFGVWKQKEWGLNLEMVIALIFLLGALPTLFALGGRNINWLRTSLNILSLVASTPILVLSILPSVRDAVK